MTEAFLRMGCYRTGHGINLVHYFAVGPAASFGSVVACSQLQQ